MKTVEEIRREITENAVQMKKLKEEFKHGKARAIGKKNAVLKTCLYYLETNPRPEYVRIMESDLKRKIDIIDKNFEVWKKTNTKVFPNLLIAYRTEMGYKDLREQLKTVQYLLT